MLHQCCLVACTIQLLRAMRDAEKFSSRLLRKRVLDICCSSLPSNIFPWAPSAEYNARCPYMSPVSWQHSATGPLCNLHTSPYIHKNKNLAQDQPDGRKSSVDAHGVSSCLGCSRILRHLISFLTSSQDFRSRKNYGTRNSSHTSEQGQSRLYTQFMRVKLIIRHVNPCCTNAVLLLVQFSCSERWDEGCRKDLFKTSQKKGVGYLLLITAFQYFPLGSVRSVQRKMPLHVTSVMTALCHGSTLQSPHIIFYPQKERLSTRSTRRKKVLSRRAWCVFMLRM